eukprot:GDKH01000866.1.p1 GENE.GDKH01000866.1~~GDKH01000866.1.p1  ORF type:complete len:324 (-),score=33.10 GDKH01000866.1:284-1255(-)
MPVMSQPNNMAPTTPTTTPKSVSSREHILDKKDLERPDIAYPTLLLAASAATAFFVLARTRLYWEGSSESAPLLQSRLITVPLSAICIFALFTPMHDAAHGSVSPRYKWINGAVGRFCAYFYFAPYPAFRFVHLQHHKHVNDPHNDPDYWSATGPRFLLPLRWMSQEMHYYVPYLKRGDLDQPQLRQEVIVTFLGMYGAVALTSWLGIASLSQWFWTFLLPLRLAVLILAWTFDYIPHAPHQNLRADGEYKTTSLVTGVLSDGDVAPQHLGPLMLYQNLHFIHHLYPSIPWYRYKVAYERHRDTWARMGIPKTLVYRKDRAWL